MNKEYPRPALKLDKEDLTTLYRIKQHAVLIFLCQEFKGAGRSKIKKSR